MSSGNNIFKTSMSRLSDTNTFRLQPISPKVRKFEGSWVRRFFSPKVRKLEKKVLESERKGSVVRRYRIPKSWNMQFVC